MKKKNRLCIFCGSQSGHNPDYQDLAIRLGRLAALHKIELIYGGGDIGLMGILANAALSEGGKVVGILPSILEKQEIGHQKLSELIITPNMHIRKSQMYEKSDAFAILPGGVGTLDEFFEILTWKHIGLHQKQIFVVNYKNYWDPLKDLLSHILLNGFSNPNLKNFLQFVEDEKALFKELQL